MVYSSILTSDSTVDFPVLLHQKFLSFLSENIQCIDASEPTHKVESNEDAAQHCTTQKPK